MVQVPGPLRDRTLRFYLIGAESKIPMEKQWNTENNYQYDDPAIISHTGNYGLVTGIGNIVVLDFDDKEYHDRVKRLIPRTFTVTTATKRLPHYYFRLSHDETVPKKIPIDLNGDRVCDIQGQRSGVVAPGSVIGRRYYEHNGEPVAEISIAEIKRLFGLGDDDVKISEPFKVREGDLAKMNVALAVVHCCGVEARTETNMACPFHSSKGNKNLSITTLGKIYCFHCLGSWWPDEFYAKVKKVELGKAKVCVKMIERLYRERK